MSKNQAGKGDKPRPVVKKQFDSNFDDIAWKESQNKKQGVTKKGKTTFKY